MPYLVLLIIIGIPLFFLELAVGQRIRRGSIGVWHYVCPRLGGIGFSSCIVSPEPAGPFPGGVSRQESWAGAGPGPGQGQGRSPPGGNGSRRMCWDHYFLDGKLFRCPEQGVHLGM